MPVEVTGQEVTAFSYHVGPTSAMPGFPGAGVPRPEFPGSCFPPGSVLCPASTPEKTRIWKSSRFSTGPGSGWLVGWLGGWDALGCRGAWGGSRGQWGAQRRRSDGMKRGGPPTLPQREASLRQSRRTGTALNCFPREESEHAYSPLHKHNAHHTVHGSKQPRAKGRPPLLLTLPSQFMCSTQCRWAWRRNFGLR